MTLKYNTSSLWKGCQVKTFMLFQISVLKFRTIDSVENSLEHGEAPNGPEMDREGGKWGK
jgi:hypothetical protein